MSFCQEFGYVGAMVPSEMVSKTWLKRCINLKSKDGRKKIFGK